jgi:PIN domain nuclease of toxin-antitoxin system
VNGYLLDTHAWVWIIRGSSDEVSKRFFSEVEDWQRQGLAYLSPISCWELGLLVAGSQILLDQPIEALWERDTSRDAFRIAELTAPILVESTRLPGDLHRDPSDRILAATARANGLTLVTRDWRLLDYAKQGHLKARKPERYAHT